MPLIRLTCFCIVGTALLSIGSSACAVTAPLGVSKDNSIYANSVNNSAGADTNLYSGLAGPGIRRALLAFDIAGSIPAGSTITGVQLTLNVNKQGTNSGSENFSLHRLTADWGEGTSTGGGQGAAAVAPDATWNENFFGTSSWTTPGGDFNAAASDTQSISGLGNVTWGSTPGLVADVQSWLDNPSSNFGWILRGDESASRTARRFAAQGAGNNAPLLSITYVPEPTALVLFTFAALVVTIRRKHR